MTKKLETTTVIEQLAAARDLIEKGWSQGAFHAANQYGHYYCIIGAINKVTGYSDHNPHPWGRDESLKALRNAIAPSPYGEAAGWIISFNDAHGQKKENVLRLFNRVIAKEMGVPELKGDGK